MFAMSQTQPENTDSLSVLGYEDDEEMERGVFDNRLVRNVIDVQKLEDEVKSFLGALERIIGNLSQEVGKYRMETVTVTAEVNAKGKVSLLGSGGEVGGKGGLTFTFKRSG
jgi:hypothetical protein